MAMATGLNPAGNVCWGARLILPLTLELRSTEMVSSEFATARSSLPSPSKSPTAMLCGLKPVAKSSLGARETKPPALVLRRTDKKLVLLLATTRSARPSPSKSPRATLKGPGPVGKFKGVRKEFELSRCVLEKVGTKGLGEYAVSPRGVVTVTWAKVTPNDTVTDS